MKGLLVTCLLMRKEILYLSRNDIENLDIDMRTVIDAVEKAFREKGLGRVEMPPKPGIHPKENSFIHAMPAYIPRIKAAGIKWVAGYPENREIGLPYITGLLILNDPETGLPISVMDCTWMTAKRTGAATAVAAKYLARKDSRILGIIGCGVQGRSNLEALLEVLEIEEVKAYDINDANLENYVREMTQKHGISIEASDSPRKAVEDSDIIVTATPILKRPKPIIGREWLKPGVFGCPLDFDSYWKPEAMRFVDKFCTDDLEQLMYYRSIGYFSGIPDVYADLSEIVIGKKPGRESEEERILSMNLGLAIEDMATAIIIYQKALEKGVGTWLKL